MTTAASSCAEAGLALLRTADPGAASTLRRAADPNDTRRQTRLLLAVADGRPDGFSSLAAEYPDWDEPLVLLAQALREAGDWIGAEQAYRRALALDPHRVEALTALGAHLATSEPGEARVLLSLACHQPGATWEAWHALGVACLKDGAPKDAVTALDWASLLVPARLDILLLRGDAACAAGDADGEFARLDRLDPLDPWNMTARAALLEANGQGDAALDELEAATAISPEDPVALAALGSLLARRGQSAEAEPVLRRAVAAGAGQQARLDLSTLLMKRQHAAEALEMLDALIAEYGRDMTLLCNRAVALCSLGRQKEAVAAARNAAETDPGSFLPWRALANTMPYSPDATGTALLEVAQAGAARLPRGAPVPRRAAPNRLRVGLLSGSLRTHPVGWLTVAGFEHLDRSRFDLVCLGPSGTEPLARRFAAASTSWIDTTGLSDPALASLAREQALDIVIDAGGHGDTGRVTACAYRLAPVQAKWVGMQNATTGLPEMDWFISDRWETPPELGDLYTERLMIMPDGYVCYSPPAYAPDVAPLPALSRGHVTFGCFNNLSKVTPAVIAAWSAILRRLPDARFVFKNHQLDEAVTRAAVSAAFAAEGVEGRVELRGASQHRELLRQYADIDLVLDPFPYGGGLTTCEALWMGVPTVTLAGDYFAARHSLSHLNNVGLADWDAPDVASYIALACGKAANVAELARLRSGLRPQMDSSPLCDAPRFGRSLGWAIERMWTET